MNELNNSEYYARREAAERKLAAKAHDRAIAKIHADLAERYALLASQRSPNPGLHVVR
ncbi:hypothetical protein [Sphingomonas sp. GB1N7]|uniref:hypothetical protein n=1 Tax=Parasphingomonas caseinilytica TaxID=3096158 RepID=UPI002FC5A79D